MSHIVHSFSLDGLMFDFSITSLADRCLPAIRQETAGRCIPDRDARGSGWQHPVCKHRRDDDGVQDATRHSRLGSDTYKRLGLAAFLCTLLLGFNAGKAIAIAMNTVGQGLRTPLWSPQ